MFENPRRGRQAKNFTTNIPKILDLKSFSEQIFFPKLSLGAPEKTIKVRNSLMFMAFFLNLTFSSINYIGPALFTWTLILPLGGHLEILQYSHRTLGSVV